MNNFSTTGPSSSNSYSYSNNFCQYRLPCGYCTMLNKDCPKQYTTITLNNTVPTSECKGN